jgi:hypothetical protein
MSKKYAIFDYLGCDIPFTKDDINKNLSKFRYIMWYSLFKDKGAQKHYKPVPHECQLVEMTRGHRLKQIKVTKRQGHGQLVGCKRKGDIRKELKATVFNGRIN